VSQIDLSTSGWINPVLAFAMATLGCLLAVMLAIKARARPRRGRGRLLGYATVALGGIGIFQSHILAILGFGLRGAAVRYDLLTMLESLGTAIVAVGGGLLLVSVGRRTTMRLATAATLIGAGMAAAHHVAVSGMRAAGYLYYEPVRFAGSIAIAVLAGCAVCWFLVSLRGLRAAILAASVSGAAICGMHYTAMSAVRGEPGPLLAVDGSDPITGFPPMVLLGPALLLGAAVIAMLWFFTVGASTVDDLNNIFEDPEHSVEIEPWLIEEIATRIALGYCPPVSLRAGGDATAKGVIAPGAAARDPATYATPARNTATYGTARNRSATRGSTAGEITRGTARHRMVKSSNTAKGTAVPPTHAARRRSTSASVPAQRRPAVESCAPNAGPATPGRYPPGYTHRYRNHRHA
jgi:NO-binding membrane sensor protein with MHYT domain